MSTRLPGLPCDRGAGLVWPAAPSAADVAVARRFLAVVATLDGFGGCDGAAGTGRVAAGGEA